MVKGMATQLTLGFSGKGFSNMVCLQIFVNSRHMFFEKYYSQWVDLFFISSDRTSVATNTNCNHSACFPAVHSLNRSRVRQLQFYMASIGAGQLSVIGCMKTDHRLSIQYITDASRFNGLPSHEAQLCRKNRVRYRKWVSYNFYSFLCRSLSLALEVVERRKTSLLLLYTALSIKSLLQLTIIPFVCRVSLSRIHICGYIKNRAGE